MKAIPKKKTRSQPRFRWCFGVLFSFWVTALLADALRQAGNPSEYFRSPPAQSAAAVALAALAAVLWKYRAIVFHFLTSLRFAVTLLLGVLVASMCGTFIVQLAPRQHYIQQYGALLAPWIFRLGLDDLFHTVWFNGFLCLLTCSLVLVPFKNRAWRPALWGHLCAHLGVAVILIGAMLGSLAGFKGVINLHEGQVAERVAVTDRHGEVVRRLPMDFALRLDDFTIEHYEPEFRVYVYHRGEEGRHRAVASYGLDDVASWREIKGRDARFRVKQVYPDFALRAQLLDVPDGEGKPGVAITLRRHGSTHHEVLLDGEETSLSDPPYLEDTVVRFVWKDPGRDALADAAGMRTPAHTIVFRKSDCCPGEIVHVQPGGEYPAGDGAYRIRVLRFFPDFMFDLKTKNPYSRSGDPVNPALQVAIRKSNPGIETTRWLFANMPGYDAMHGAGRDAGPVLEYHYQSGRDPAQKALMIVGETREVMECASGKVIGRRAYDSDSFPLPGLPDAHATIHRSAGRREQAVSMSREWNNPVIDLELVRKGSLTTHRLSATHARPVPLADTGTFLAFERKPNDVKAFYSHLSILEHGERVAEKTIAVNDPLDYRGYVFYQSNYRKEDPTFSGLLVVKDPGLPVVYAGFLMTCFGTMYAFYLHPKIVANMKRHA